MAKTFSLGNGQWARKKGAILGSTINGDNLKPAPLLMGRASQLSYFTRDNRLVEVGRNEPLIDYRKNPNGTWIRPIVNVTQLNPITNGRNSLTIISGTQAGTLTRNVDDPFGGKRAYRYRCDNNAGDNKNIRNNISVLTAGTDYYRYMWIRCISNANQTITWDLCDRNNTNFTLENQNQWYLIERADLALDNGSNFVDITLNDFSVSSVVEIEVFGPFVYDHSEFVQPVITSGSAITIAYETIAMGGYDYFGLSDSYNWTLVFKFGDLYSTAQNDGILSFRDQTTQHMSTRMFRNGNTPVVATYLDSQTIYPFGTSGAINAVDNGVLIYRLNNTTLSRFAIVGSTMTKQETEIIPFGLSKITSPLNDEYTFELLGLDVYDESLTDTECEAIVNQGT